LQTDIFKEYIAQKEWLFPPQPHLRLIGDLMEFCSSTIPAYKPLSVSGAIHEKIGVPRGKLLKKQFDVEDFAAGFIRFDNGASLTLEISWGGHQAEPESMSTTVMGTKGTIVHRNLNGTYDFIGEYFTETKGHKLAGMVAQSRQDVRSSYGEMVRAIINDTDPLANAEDGLRVQQILDGLYKSAATGKEVAIK